MNDIGHCSQNEDFLLGRWEEVPMVAMPWLPALAPAVACAGRALTEAADPAGDSEGSL